MKESKENETNLVRRNRSQHSRVRNTHFGSSWIRRTPPYNPQEPRGSCNALGSHQIRSNCFRQHLDETGSVTAEFAIVLPGVLILLYLAISVMGIQSSRIGLVELAAECSRALARGESEAVVEQLIQESGRSIASNPAYSDLSVCVELVQIHRIQALGTLFPLELKEVQCARKGGL